VLGVQEALRFYNFSRGELRMFLMAWENFKRYISSQPDLQIILFLQSFLQEFLDDVLAQYEIFKL